MMRFALLPVSARGLLAAALLCVAAVAPAQTKPEPVYEIELVVFRQQLPAGKDAELPPRTVEPPQAPQVVSLQQSGGNASYVALAPSELQLGGVVDSMRRSARYEPLLHIGWRQPGLGQKQSAAIAVPIDWQPWSGEAPLPLHGLVRFYRERYAHVEVDLRYQLPAEEAAAAGLSPAPAEPAEDTGSFWSRSAPAPEPAPVVYVHRQSRRLEPSDIGRLQYLDHPVVGVVVQVRQVGTN